MLQNQITQAFAQLVQAGHTELLVITSADGNTIYMAFAPPGARMDEPQWFACKMVKVTAEDGVVTQRKACAPGPCAATNLTELSYTQDGD